MSATPVTTPGPGDLRFFRTTITAMAAVLVGGFVLQLAMGRSSFGAPLIVHLHALAFMGWVAIVVTQAWLVAGGRTRLHRGLGALAVVWLCAMLALGPLVTIAAVRTGRVPFFFQPQHLLLADLAMLFGAAGLVAAAVALRKNRDWHPRLQIGAFMMLMGPGIGRILPMPLLGAHAFEIASVIPLVVPLIGMARDKRVHGRVHPAWAWSISLLVVVLVAVRLITFSPVGDAIYAAAAAGSPAAGSDGRAFPRRRRTSSGRPRSRASRATAIDLVVAGVLMSMGMMMLPPVVVSLPFKLIFFVLVDGWRLVAGSLVESFQHGAVPPG